MLNRIIYAFAVLAFLFPVVYPSVSFAEESTVNHVKDDAGDGTTAAKKGVRKVKRQVRQATGNDTVIKDVKDKANDAGDTISNDANKAKRKVESN